MSVGVCARILRITNSVQTKLRNVMSMTTVRSTIARLSTLGCAALLLVSCGSTNSGEGGSVDANNGADDIQTQEDGSGQGTAPVSQLEDGFIRDQEEGTPVPGGELRLASFLEPASLDPAETIVAGTTGGIEMLNLYDSLTRWSVDENAFIPQTAESVESNDEFDEWTVTLRPDITFSDGTDYDAEAVKASQERYASMPSPEGNFWNENVDSVEIIDDHTLRYELTSPWSDFPSLLSGGPGMILAKAAYEGGEEEFEPIGAGPFTLDEWVPSEHISFTKRDDYWAGEPNLDGFTSVFLDDQQVAVDTLNSGGVDAVFALHASFVEQLMDGGYNGLASTLAAGASVLINASEGYPGEDIRVRKAIQLAIDPQVVMERAYQGAVDGDPTLFPANSMWHTTTAGVEPDVDQAKELLEEAKADGYDGKIEHVDLSDPSNRNRAGAIQALLEAAGFEVEVDLRRTSAEQIQRVSVDVDYGTAAWGTNVRNVNPLPRFFTNLHSEGNQLSGIYTSEEMDSYIEEFQAAPDDESRRAAIDKIQQQINEDAPFVVLGQLAELLAWGDHVFGVTESANTTVLLDKAWLAQE